jgi:DNA-binding NarL/FixJ family response regulator
MNILIADSQPKVRYALGILLQGHPGWVVTGAAVDAAELSAKLATLQPDVVLLDLDLPGLALQELSQAFHAQRQIILVVMSPHPERYQEVKARGADFFVSKIDPPSKLLEIIRQCEQQFTRARAAPEQAT